MYHSLNSLSIEWAWGIIKWIEELAAKNYGKVDLFSGIKQVETEVKVVRRPCDAVLDHRS